MSGGGGEVAADRLQQFRQAQAKARAIAIAAEKAGPAEKAASWLSQYGPNCVGKDAGYLSWTPAFASSCLGSKEAADYIRDAAIMMLPTIIAEAEELATAEMLKLMALLHTPNPKD
jgi:hypothetical protein